MAYGRWYGINYLTAFVITTAIPFANQQSSAKPLRSVTSPSKSIAQYSRRSHCDNHNARCALDSSGKDIFAKANKAAISGGTPGVVLIPPGEYGMVTTTLKCRTGIVFLMGGVTIHYVGNGTAIQCSNVQDAAIVGPAKIVGPGSSGHTIGMQLGIGSGGNGTVTTYNYFSDLHFRNFNKCFMGEGSTSDNGTYSNYLSGVTADSCNVGFYLVPTIPNCFNANECVGCIAIGNKSDGFYIDGANGNAFIGSRAELNGGFGWNFKGTIATTNNSILHSWNEANSSGDFNAGSPVNVTQTTIWGGIGISSPVFAGQWAGGGNRRCISAVCEFTPDGSPTVFHINSSVANSFAFAVTNDEAPVSGITNVVGVSRTGSTNGNLFLGTPEYPSTFRSVVNANGNPVTGATSLSLNPVTFSQLGSAGNGTILYCSDCKVENPCANGGTGALAKRLNGVWVCN